MASGRRRGLDLGILLLAYQLVQFGLDKVPPVTLVYIAGQVAVYLGLIPFLDPTYRTYDLCMHAGKVWYKGQFGRLLASSIMHADDMHLYYNMISFLYKGYRLEKRLGSKRFLVVLVLFALLTSVVMVGISVLLEEALDIRSFHLMEQCAIGFSGVIFALKVVCNDLFPYDESTILGHFPVPTKYACWIELLVIRILAPKSSFLGHLSGILVGLIYTYGPLKWIINGLLSIFDPMFTGDDRRANPRFYGSGTWGEAGQHWQRYANGLSEEEQIRRAMQNSVQGDGTGYSQRQRPSAPPPYPYG